MAKVKDVSAVRLVVKVEPDAKVHRVPLGHGVEEERLVPVEAERLGEVAVVAQEGVALKVQRGGARGGGAAQAPRPVAGGLLRRDDLRLPRNRRLELDLAVVGAVGIVGKSHGVVVVGRVCL